MLPDSLHGPAKTIGFESPDAFLRANRATYPDLDPDFIIQICFEHPDRFNEYFPGFDPACHCAQRIEKTIGWVYDSVRYDGNEAVDFWSGQFDFFRESNQQSYAVFAHMMRHRTWPFPPVIIEADFAASLGAAIERLGKPYHLIEGTHRVSYARRMLELALLTRECRVEIIEVMPWSPLQQTGCKRL